MASKTMFPLMWSVWGNGREQSLWLRNQGIRGAERLSELASVIPVCLLGAQAPLGKSVRRSKSLDLFAVGAERGAGCLDSSLLT